MLAHNVDDRHVCPARIVQVRDPIGETRTEMKKSACWFSGHPCIAICGCRDNTLKQTEYAPHSSLSVECRNDVHFRGARIRKANFDPSGDQRRNQTFSPVHQFTTLGTAFQESCQTTMSHFLGTLTGAV
jgi:hypothetical protein